MEHRPPSHDIIHAPSLEQIGFEEYEPPEGFCPLWRSYRGEGETSGSFHILAPSDRWQIAIHDFTLLHDTVMEFELPEYLSVAWYESISGEEFTPYRRLRAKSIWGFYSGDGGWRGLVHGGVPVKAVSIEVRPEMSRAYLEREYDGQFERVRDAFASLSDDGDSPELRALLAGLWPARATSIAASCITRARCSRPWGSSSSARKRAGTRRDAPSRPRTASASRPWRCTSTTTARARSRWTTSRGPHA